MRGPAFEGDGKEKPTFTLSFQVERTTGAKNLGGMCVCVCVFSCVPETEGSKAIMAEE